MIVMAEKPTKEQKREAFRRAHLERWATDKPFYVTIIEGGEVASHWRVVRDPQIIDWTEVPGIPLEVAVVITIES